MKKVSRHKKTTEYHHGNLRSACMKEAIRILAKKGPSELSLRDIARKLGVSHGAPYRHFQSREGLLASIAAEGFLTFAEQLSLKADESETSSTEERLGQMGQAFLQFALDYPVHFKLMFSKAIPNTEKYPDLQEAGKGAFAVLYEMVQRMQKEKVLKPSDPTTTSIFIWSTLHGFCSLILDDRLKFLDIGPDVYTKMVETMHQSMMQGLKVGSDSE